MFIIFSLGMGFIIFCFQLGLRRRWYLWCLVYAALAFLATYLTDIVSSMVLFEGFSGDRLFINVAYYLVAYLIVFVLLFLFGRAFVLVTSLRKGPRSLLSK